MFRTRHKRVAHASIAFDGIVTWSIFFLWKVSHRSSSRFFFWPRHTTWIHTIPFLMNSPFNVTLSGSLHNLHFRRYSINLSSATKNYIYMRCPGTRFKDVFRMSIHFNFPRLCHPSCSALGTQTPRIWSRTQFAEKSPHMWGHWGVMSLLLPGLPFVVKRMTSRQRQGTRPSCFDAPSIPGYCG